MFIPVVNLAAAAVGIVALVCLSNSVLAHGPAHDTTRLEYTLEEEEHANCSVPCLSEAVHNWRDINRYNTCMRKCLTRDWPLNYIESKAKTCETLPLIPEIFPNGSYYPYYPPVCNPTFHWLHHYGVESGPNGFVQAYPIATFKPCRAGIVDLKGFEVLVLPTAYNFYVARCIHINLTRPFTLDDQFRTFSAVMTHPVPFDNMVKIEMKSLPPTPGQEYENFTQPTLNCFEYNSDKCLCAEHRHTVGGYKAPKPKVTVDGYTVRVQAATAPLCERSKRHSVKLVFMRSGSGHVAVDKYVRVTKDTVNFTYVFHHLWETNRGDTYFGVRAGLYFYVQVRVGEQDGAAQRFDPKNWKTIVNTTFLSLSSIEAKFPVASSGYNISKYAIRLSRANSTLSYVDALTTVQEKAISADKAVNGSITARYYNLEPGLWCVQVKELRGTSRYKHFHYWKAVQWSACNEFFVDKPPIPFNNNYVPGISILVILVGLVLLVVLFLYLWKLGRCAVVRHYVPNTLSKWLDAQTFSSMTLRSHTVLLVWQTDTRSPELLEKHSNVVRHLAAFLRSVCGLNVILDMFEEAQMTTAVSKWLQNSYEKAEFVLFLCPHFDCDTIAEKGGVRPLTGDFNYIFRYLEPHIRDRRKFVTALLPYSDIQSCSASKWLQNGTRAFKFMDEIDDFYFHTQGRSKVNFAGRHTVRHVSRKDYTQTPQGTALHESMDEMMQLLAASKRASSTLTHNSSSSERSSRRSSRISTAAVVEEQTTARLPVSSRDNDISADLQVNKVQVAPPEQVECIANPNLEQKIQSPPPLVEDAEEQIRLINKSPQKDSPAPWLSCQYHNVREKEHSSPHFPRMSNSVSVDPPAETSIPMQPIDENEEEEEEDDDESVMRFLRQRELLPPKSPPIQVCVQSLASSYQDVVTPNQVAISVTSLPSEMAASNDMPRQYEEENCRISSV